MLGPPFIVTVAQIDMMVHCLCQALLSLHEHVSAMPAMPTIT